MRSIVDVLQERGDLSTFVVHFTRGEAPYANLVAILTGARIEARSCFGLAQARALAELHPGTAVEEKQKAVCFTETPLQFAHLMCEQLQEHREKELAPYGVGFTRIYARLNDANPVWYIDTSRPPGGFRHWLTNPLAALVAVAEAEATTAGPEVLAALPILELAPFIETMGRTQAGTRKEFWWEREWRKVGDFVFAPSAAVVVLAPEQDHDQLRGALASIPGYAAARLVDVHWDTTKLTEAIAGVTTSRFRRDRGSRGRP